MAITFNTNLKKKNNLYNNSTLGYYHDFANNEQIK